MLQKRLGRTRVNRDEIFGDTGMQTLSVGYAGKSLLKGGVWGFQHRISKSIYSMFPNIDRFVSYTIL